MYIKYDRDKLHDLYVSRKLSMSKIASMYNVSTMTIRAWLKKNNIQTRPSTHNVYKELKQTPFGKDQQSLIIGSILGDGSLTQRRDCKNARFTERHGEDQKDYTVWKKNKLKPFTKSNLEISDGGKHIISGVKCVVGKSYKFTTISHPWLTDLRSLFYPEGIKAIPYNLYDLLNNLAVAIWICDDGCLTYEKKNSTYRLDLHTESFTYKENVFLCRDILSKMFNLGFRINSRKYKSGKAYYICLSGKKSLYKLVNEIYSFVPDCMKYKFKHYIT